MKMFMQHFFLSFLPRKITNLRSKGKCVVSSDLGCFLKFLAFPVLKKMLENIFFLSSVFSSEVRVVKNSLLKGVDNRGKSAN